MKFIWSVTMLVGFLNTTVNAQFERAPPCMLRNPELAKQLKHGAVAPVSLSGASSYGLMATSTLNASGANPYDVVVGDNKKNKTEEEQRDADLAEIESVNNSQDWECQYAAQNLSDGQPATAWVEGVAGDGIGEVVIAGPLEIKKPVKIWAGYGKSEALFKANNRPARVTVYLLATNCPQPTESAIVYDSLFVIAMKTITLKDVNGYQNVALPAPVKPWIPGSCGDYNPLGRYFVALEILTVYPGLRYHDTCISEIGN